MWRTFRDVERGPPLTTDTADLGIVAELMTLQRPG